MRIVISRFLAAPFLLSLSLISTVPAQATFHGNLARTGVFDSSGPKRLSGVKWAFKTKGAIFGSPAVANGTVFIGSSDGSMYAVEQATGQQKWKSATGGSIASSPAVADGMVFFLSYDGGMYAVDAATGTRKWRYSTSFERKFEAKGLHGANPSSQLMADPFDIFLSSPAVFNGRVYFGSSDGNVYALDEKTGIVAWKFETRDVVHASPSISGNTVYIGSWDSYLYALDSETGAEKWRFKTGEDPVAHNQVGLQSSAAIVGDTVYVGCRDGHVYAIDAATGRKRWDYPTSKSWVNDTPAIYQGSVFFGTGDTRRFHSIDAKTGKLQFTVNTFTNVWTSPAVADGYAYFGNLNGSFYAIDIATGSVAWEFQTDSAKKDILQVLNPDRTRKNESPVNGFGDFEDMYVYWYKNFSLGAIVSSPAIDHGEIYFGSTDGNLYALN